MGMKKLLFTQHSVLVFFLISICLSCGKKNKIPSDEAINAINLKRGEIISCGPPSKQFGTVAFDMSCPEKVRKDFDLAIALLHSFEYEEAEKAFAKVIEQEPACAMAYWGVAMSNYHQVWPSPPSPVELEKGNKAIIVAQSLSEKTARESDYINAMAQFYKDWNKVDHRTRALNFQKAMESLYKKYPADKEAAIFYALALDGSADPADKTYSNQKKAGAILSGLYPNEPDHPGIVHYIIHSYDYPELGCTGIAGCQKICFHCSVISPCTAYAFTYFYQAWAYGMNAFNQILFLFLLPNAMQKAQE